MKLTTSTAAQAISQREATRWMPGFCAITFSRLYSSRSTFVATITKASSADSRRPRTRPAQTVLSCAMAW